MASAFALATFLTCIFILLESGLDQRGAEWPDRGDRTLSPGPTPDRPTAGRELLLSCSGGRRGRRRGKRGNAVSDGHVENNKEEAEEAASRGVRDLNAKQRSLIGAHLSVAKFRQQRKSFGAKSSHWRSHQNYVLAEAL